MNSNLTPDQVLRIVLAGGLDLPLSALAFECIPIEDSDGEQRLMLTVTVPDLYSLQIAQFRIMAPAEAFVAFVECPNTYIYPSLGITIVTETGGEYITKSPTVLGSLV